ncbi:hypothetical protein Tco_1378299 [Tanacetum coccineum]
MSRSREGRMAYTFELMDIVPLTPHDSPLPRGYTPRSDEARLKLEELMAMYTKLSKQVLDLEKEKDAQAVEILKLKKNIRKTEEVKHLTPKKEDIQVDGDFDRLDDDMENVEGETVYAATSGVSTVEALVSTARPTVSTDEPSTSDVRTLIGVLEDEMVTMADTLIAIIQTRTRPSYLPRPTSVVITDTKQEQRRLTTPPPSQPSDTRCSSMLLSDKSKKAESSEKKAEGSRKKSIGKKRAGKSKNKINYQKTNIEWMMKRRQIHEEAEEMEEAGMKKHIEDFKMIGNIH